MAEERREFKKKDTNTLVSIQLEGYEVIEKIVKSSGNSGRIYLPNAWVGSKVKVIRISPIDKEIE